MMLTTPFGVFWIFLLCCCSKSEAKLSLKSRTSVALAGKTVIHQLKVTIPPNGTKDYIICYQNMHRVWQKEIEQNPSPNSKIIELSPNITMHNSSSSGEYYFSYKSEKLYWVVLVRDVGYLPDTESFIIPLLVVIILLLLLSIAGSVYIFKWYKNQSLSEGDGDKVKAKNRTRNAVATVEGATSDSVYTALDHRTVSVYDVLNVDEARKAKTESQTSNKKAKPSPVEEGIFESVYENL
ncbi:hypothetical protein PHYPO_G00153210 [Pangasianodon hypophthalmus]|uniref:Immunoglobulin subtype domain-containing protein n=1 Tax=Pangasianodon hypophthalmus TaxID=310915 RepID=A0A5N5K218_PANHP|nr:hypothetical protein PHYPO_G00153210 [Pangasianodon hypophthalmus]